MDVAGDYF